MLNETPEAMEKLMFFGLAMLFEIMTAIPPQPRHIPPRPVPVNGQNDIETVTRNNPNIVNDNSNSKPVKIYPCAEYWHSPE